MLNSNKKVTGSIIMPRLIIVVEIPGSILQSLSGPRVPAVGLTVSFSIMYMLKGTASDHSDDSIFAQSKW